MRSVNDLRGHYANVVSPKGWSPLHEAVNHGRQNQEPMVALLLEAGADPNAGRFLSPLVLAAWDSPQEVVRLLVDYGADVNFRSRAGNALSKAVIAGRSGIVRLLIEYGADPLLKLPADSEYSGLNIIEIARQTDHSAIVAILESQQDRQ